MQSTKLRSIIRYFPCIKISSWFYYGTILQIARWTVSYAFFSADWVEEEKGNLKTEEKATSDAEDSTSSSRTWRDVQNFLNCQENNYHHVSKTILPSVQPSFTHHK